MSRILDQSTLLFASVAVLVVSLLVQMSLRPLVPRSHAVFQLEQVDGTPVAHDAPHAREAPAQPWWSFSFYTPLLILAGIYVPGTLLVTNLIARLGAFGAVFERDYSPLLACASMAWAAVHIPLVVVAWFAPIQVLAVVAAVAYFYFAVLMFFAVRTVFGIENNVAVGSVCLSIVPLAAAVVFWGPLQFILGWLASPFFLFYAFYYLGGEFRNLGVGLRRSQNFRRMLEAAAINPHDAEAQYQLGLVYQHRRQYTAAIQRFKNAVTIDPRETDAHFQLGRIARQQGRLKDALGHFQTVVDQDEKHHQSEILRELGAVYLAARQYQDARNELAEYVERRPYDSEGLLYYGQALEGLGDTAGAREMYARAIEAARSAPRYLRRSTAKWSRTAQKLYNTQK
jgi:tetratricopeptide (TPR) repeat protein